MKKLILIALLISACGQTQSKTSSKAIAGPDEVAVLPTPTPHALVGTWIAQDYAGNFTFTDTTGSDSMCGWSFQWQDQGSNTYYLTNLSTVVQTSPCDPAGLPHVHYMQKYCSVYFWDSNHISMSCLYNGSHDYVRQ